MFGRFLVTGMESVWKYEPKTFHLSSLGTKTHFRFSWHAKNELGPQWTNLESSSLKFIQWLQACTRMLTKHEMFCMKNNQLPSKVKDNSNVSQLLSASTWICVKCSCYSIVYFFLNSHTVLTFSCKFECDFVAKVITSGHEPYSTTMFSESYKL